MVPIFQNETQKSHKNHRILTFLVYSVMYDAFIDTFMRISLSEFVPWGPKTKPKGVPFISFRQPREVKMQDAWRELFEKLDE